MQTSTSFAFGQKLKSLLDGTGINSERQREPLAPLCRETFDDHPNDLRFPVLGDAKDGPAAVPRVDIAIDQESA